AEAIEIVARIKDGNNPVIGKQISELNLPDGVIVGTVVRNDEVIMSSRDLVIEENDHVLLLLTDVSKIHEVERLFSEE
ncbi:MAG: TrkA C-terminal domain-containing protein, partial [Gammaproteobacteria bacterium]